MARAMEIGVVELPAIEVLHDPAHEIKVGSASYGMPTGLARMDHGASQHPHLVALIVAWTLESLSTENETKRLNSQLFVRE